jgi:hypothetical protein
MERIFPDLCTYVPKSLFLMDVSWNLRSLFRDNRRLWKHCGGLWRDAIDIRILGVVHEKNFLVFLFLIFILFSPWSWKFDISLCFEAIFLFAFAKYFCAYFPTESAQSEPCTYGRQSKRSKLKPTLFFQWMPTNGRAGRDPKQKNRSVIRIPYYNILWYESTLCDRICMFGKIYILDPPEQLYCVAVFLATQSCQNKMFWGLPHNDVIHRFPGRQKCTTRIQFPTILLTVLRCKFRPRFENEEVWKPKCILTWICTPNFSNVINNRKVQCFKILMLYFNSMSLRVHQS